MKTKQNKYKHKNTKSKNMKTPDSILYKDEDSGEILVIDKTKLIKHVIKEYEVKPISDEDTGMSKSAEEIVAALLDGNFRQKTNEFELDDGLDSYADVNTHIFEMTQAHKKIIKEQEEEQDKIKDKKAQEKKLEAERKEAEEKQYKESQEKFEKSFFSMSQKLKKTTEDFVISVKSHIERALPKTVTLSQSGMGLLLSPTASPEDIAKAVAATSAVLTGSNQSANVLQFFLGDLINESVIRKVYKNTKDAAEKVRTKAIESLGSRGDYSLGALQQFALQSRRIPQDMRQKDVPPALYYFAAKIVAPALKDSDVSTKTALASEFDDERNKIIDEINSGKIVTQKDLQTRVNEFKKSKGILTGTESVKAKKEFYFNRLFYAVWLKENCLDEDGNVELREAGAKAIMTVSSAELTDIYAEALANLQNIIFKDHDVPAIIAREKKVKDKVDGKEQEIVIKYHIEDPFNPPKEKKEKNEDNNESKE